MSKYKHHDKGFFQIGDYVTVTVKNNWSNRTTYRHKPTGLRIKYRAWYFSNKFPMKIVQIRQDIPVIVVYHDTYKQELLIPICWVDTAPGVDNLKDNYSFLASI